MARSPENTAGESARRKTRKITLIVQGDEIAAARARTNFNFDAVLNALDHATEIEGTDEPVRGHNDSRRVWIRSRFRRRFQKGTDPTAPEE